MVKDPNCSLPVFPANKLEEKIMNCVMDIYNNTDYYIEKHKAEHKQIDTSLYDKRLQAIDKQIKRLLDLYQFEEIDASEIRSRIETLQEERKSIIQAKKQIVHYDYNEFRDLAQALGDDWDNLDIDEKRDYLMCIIDKIFLDINDNIEVSIRVNKINEAK